MELVFVLFVAVVLAIGGLTWWDARRNRRIDEAFGQAGDTVQSFVTGLALPEQLASQLVTLDALAERLQHPVSPTSAHSDLACLREIAPGLRKQISENRTPALRREFDWADRRIGQAERAGGKRS